MAKKKQKKRGINTQTAMKFVRLAALAGPGVAIAIGSGDNQTKMNAILSRYTGYKPGSGFRWEWLAEGWTPYLASVLVTYGIPKLAGMIRSL